MNSEILRKYLILEFHLRDVSDDLPLEVVPAQLDVASVLAAFRILEEEVVGVGLRGSSLHYFSHPLSQSLHNLWQVLDWVLNSVQGDRRDHSYSSRRLRYRRFRIREESI